MKIKSLHNKTAEIKFKIAVFGKDMIRTYSFPNIKVKSKIIIALIAISISTLIRLLHHL